MNREARNRALMLVLLVGISFMLACGQTPTGGGQGVVAAAPANEKVGGQNPGGGGTYTVQPRDTLSKIAGDHGLDSWQKLVEANKDKYPSLATNPNQISVGWVLTIPGTSGGGSTPPAPVAEVPQPTETPPPTREVAQIQPTLPPPPPTPTEVFFPTPLPTQTPVPVVRENPNPTPVVENRVVVSADEQPTTTPVFYVESPADYDYAGYLDKNILVGSFVEEKCRGLVVRSYVGYIPISSCKLAEVYEALGADPSGEVVIFYSLGPLPPNQPVLGGVACITGKVYLNFEALKINPIEVVHEVAHRYCQQNSLNREYAGLGGDPEELCADANMQRALHIQIQVQ